jgi:hypothetical protein
LLGVGFFTLIWLAAAKFPAWSWWSRIAIQSYLIFLLHHPLIWVAQAWGFDYQSIPLDGAVFAAILVISYALAKASQWLLDGISKFFAGRKSLHAHGGNR